MCQLINKNLLEQINELGGVGKVIRFYHQETPLAAILVADNKSEEELFLVHGLRMLEGDNNHIYGFFSTRGFDADAAVKIKASAFSDHFGAFNQLAFGTE